MRSESNCADVWSRLPADKRETNCKDILGDYGSYLNIIVDDFDINIFRVAQATQSDQVLCRVRDYVLIGNWPDELVEDMEIKPFSLREMN